MRKLMWFSAGFAAACAVGAYLTQGVILLWLALGCLIAAVGMLLLRIPKMRILVAAALGCAVGACWFWTFDLLQLDMLRTLDTRTVALSAEITDYGYKIESGSAADAVTEINGKRYRVRLYTRGEESLWPGDQVQGEFRLHLTVGGGDANTYRQGEGIFLLAYPRGELTVNRGIHAPARYFPTVLRLRLKTMLYDALPADAAGFACALLLGDSTGLSYAQNTAFKVSGIRHVIAVSGLHVSILFGLVYTAAGKRRVMTALLGIPVLLLFAAVAGFSPSVTRACIMQILMILALLIGREYDPPTALGFAALIMLAINPLTVTSVSFQLSAGCMIGIFLFSGRIREYLLRRMPGKRSVITKWVVGTLSVSLSAMSVTLPLSAWYFGTVSLIGVFTNIVALWVISFIFYGILLICLSGYIWMPLAKTVGWCIAWPIRYVLLAAKALSSFPWAAVYTCSVYTVLWLVFCYILFALFLFSKKKRPLVLILCAMLGLCLSVGAAWLEPRMDDYRVTVLDVGQGQCILLQSGEHVCLVDCGGDSNLAVADLAAETLLSQGISRIDGLILTHFDRDHVGGAEALLTRLKTDVIYVPRTESDLYDSLRENYGNTLCRVGRKTTVTCGRMRITMIPGEYGKSDNESGLAVLFQTENCDILITGDRSISGEQQLMRDADLPKLEALIVGHHGASDATGLELLRVTMPDVAVISVGENNPYGHPSQEVLDRLALFGCQVLRTDQNGTVIIRG